MKKNLHTNILAYEKISVYNKFAFSKEKAQGGESNAKCVQYSPLKPFLSKGLRPMAQPPVCRKTPIKRKLKWAF